MAHQKQNDASRTSASPLTPEETSDLLSKASKVSAWMSALKKRSELRSYTGSCRDSSVLMTIRNNRIESIQTKGDFANMPINEILSRLCEAHNDALDKMEAWTMKQYENIVTALAIPPDLELLF